MPRKKILKRDLAESQFLASSPRTGNSAMENAIFFLTR